MLLSRFSLPQISGYLLVGVLCGPHGLHIMTSGCTRQVRPLLNQPGRLATAALTPWHLPFHQAPVAHRQPVLGGHRHRRRL